MTTLRDSDGIKLLFVEDAHVVGNVCEQGRDEHLTVAGSAANEGCTSFYGIFDKFCHPVGLFS